MQVENPRGPNWAPIAKANWRLGILRYLWAWLATNLAARGEKSKSKDRRICETTRNPSGGLPQGSVRHLRERIALNAASSARPSASPFCRLAAAGHAWRGASPHRLGIFMLDRSLALRFKDSERGCLGWGQLKLKKVDCGARADEEGRSRSFFMQHGWRTRWTSLDPVLIEAGNVIETHEHASDFKEW